MDVRKKQNLSLLMLIGDGCIIQEATQIATLAHLGTNLFAQIQTLVQKIALLMVFHKKTGKELMESDLMAMN
jgi:hypothetical protein